MDHPKCALGVSIGAPLMIQGQNAEVMTTWITQFSNRNS